MQVLTKKATEEVLIGKPVRIVVLETTADKVKLGILEDGDDPEKRDPEPFVRTEGPVPATFHFMAPDGEDIEIDW